MAESCWQFAGLLTPWLRDQTISKVILMKTIVVHGMGKSHYIVNIGL